MVRKKNQKSQLDPATKNFNRGVETLNRHPMFAPLLYHANLIRRQGNLCPEKAWGIVTNNGDLHCHPTRRGSPEEWTYVLAHCLLHLGFEHFQVKSQSKIWNAGCDRFIYKFLADLKLGKAPEEYLPASTTIARDEESWYRELSEKGVSPDYHGDLVFEKERPRYWQNNFSWSACLGKGLTDAVTSAVDVAGGKSAYLGDTSSLNTTASRAKAWFISSYPLLGALASNFKIIEDPLTNQRLDISVAAVDTQSKEIFVNPAAGLDEYQARFVMAHELLHVGLRHDTRHGGRDPYYWNVACDYVINSWLVEMGVGELPTMGLLYDPDLKGLSAEAIYDRIVTDLRRYRKLATLKGIGQCDILERGLPEWWNCSEGMDLDDFYRRCLAQGLVYHQESERGYLPAGLIEEIRALSQPPIPWDVELARWFDNYFVPIVRVRSYARPSRRQAATPDIPRPRYIPDAPTEEGRTFGVVLDTSGSMDSKLLGKALGAIASYSLARDVPWVRVVFCDALAYDAGYLAPEEIADRVQVKGRGGTMLQPGINLLDKAENFPLSAPLLIITDGYCDRLLIRREHAFILPVGSGLPFVPKGEVFRIK
jgi:predicted metal-dependent peptidase